MKLHALSLTLVFFVLSLLCPSLAIIAEESWAEQAGLVLSETVDSVVCRNADGSTVTVPKKPKRTIVNYTSFISPWYRSGGIAIGIPETRLVDELPVAARGLPSTGRSTAPNVERVFALKPDFLILSANIEKQRALKESASASGIPTLLLDYETYADYLGILDLFYHINGGRLADDPDGSSVPAQVDAIVARSKSLPKVRFLSLFVAAKFVHAETDRAHTAYMASLLGGSNITDELGISSDRSRVSLSLERIILADPDVILVTTMGDSDELRKKMREEFFDDEPWASLRAVRSGRVIFLEDDLFLYKPNERFPEAFSILFDALYPESAR